MSDDVALAGTHTWVVPDRPRAERLTRALSDFGFPLTTAAPEPRGTWLVTAFDPGPYVNGESGHAAMDGVRQLADAVAAAHGGAAAGGARCPSDMLEFLEQDTPVRVENPDARPPRGGDGPPAVPAVADLPVSPERVAAPVDVLAGLQDTMWGGLEHAHGPADDVPVLIRSLARPSERWRADLSELLADDLLHQGSCFSATPAAMPFIARLAADGPLPAQHRLELYLWLVTAAGAWPTSLVRDGGRAVPHGRPPRPAPWTEAVYSAVRAQRSLVVRAWPDEPPAVRFAVACLAALLGPGSAVPVSEVGVMARQQDGTRAGWCLDLGAALLTDDDAAMLRAARAMAPWAHGASLGDPASFGVSVRIYAMHVLAKAAPSAIAG